MKDLDNLKIILTSKMSIDEDTFCPQLDYTFSIPIELQQDASIYMLEDELYEFFGNKLKESFIEHLKNRK